MQYKTVSVCMLNIKLIQFNSSFKSSYQSKALNRILIHILFCRDTTEKEEKKLATCLRSTAGLFLLLCFLTFSFTSPHSHDTVQTIHPQVSFDITKMTHGRVFCFCWKASALKGAVSHALRMLNSLKSVQPNRKSNWSESPEIKWKSVSTVANWCSFCVLSLYLNYLDIRFSRYTNFLENCGNRKRYLALQAKDVGPRR